MTQRQADSIRKRQDDLLTAANPDPGAVNDLLLIRREIGTTSTPTSISTSKKRKLSPDLPESKQTPDGRRSSRKQEHSYPLASPPAADEIAKLDKAMFGSDAIRP
jgi:hypothetical protein